MIEANYRWGDGGPIEWRCIRSKRGGVSRKQPKGDDRSLSGVGCTGAPRKGDRTYVVTPNIIRISYLNVVMKRCTCRPLRGTSLRAVVNADQGSEGIDARGDGRLGDVMKTEHNTCMTPSLTLPSQ